MTEYILNAEATRVVQRNDRGIVTYRKRYKRGDVVDVSKIDEAQVKALIRDKRLVPKDEESTDDADAATADSAARTVATGSTGAVGDLGSTATQQGEQAEGAEDAEGDRYDGMSYPDLQAEAKQRTGNGGGSADDLRDRLRQADADESDADE